MATRESSCSPPVKWAKLGDFLTSQPSEAEETYGLSKPSSKVEETEEVESCDDDDDDDDDDDAETYGISKPPSKLEETEEVEIYDDSDADNFLSNLENFEIDSDKDDYLDDRCIPGYYEKIWELKMSGRYDDYEADGDTIPYGKPILQLHEDCNRPLLIILCYLSVLALQKYNRDNKANYKFVRVVKACRRRCAGVIYFITFEAVAAPTSVVQTFQAQVWNGVDKDRVNLCRLKTTNVQNLPSFDDESESDHDDDDVDFHESEADKDVFDFDLYPKDHMRDITILNLKTDVSAYYIVSHFASHAVDRFNWTTHASYLFVKVVKAMMWDNKYYITYEAEDRHSNEGAKIFRTLVWYKEGKSRTISVGLKTGRLIKDVKVAEREIRRSAAKGIH